MNQLQSKLYLKTASNQLAHSLTAVSFLENKLIETRNLDLFHTQVFILYSKACTKHLFAAEYRFI